MNKDVIYIEPEDDITDIITKIENAKEKIVALVPPKNSNIIRSAVNVKLISRAGISLGKTIVLVTSDDTVLAQAASVKMPVTKSLTSAPYIPTLGDTKAEESISKEEVIEDSASEDSDKNETVEAIEEKAAEEEKPADIKEIYNGQKDEVAEEKPKKETKDTKKDKKIKTSQNPILAWITEYKKWLIIGASAVGIITLVLIWMFAIAPSVKITLKVKTTSNNFSENIKFTKTLEEEDIESGIFYLEEQKIEQESKVEFNATGEKNVGEKASGTLTLSALFTEKGSVTVPEGTSFTYDGKVYLLEKNISMAWVNGNYSECSNTVTNVADPCYITAPAKAIAKENGEEYNLGKTTSGWTSSKSGITVASATEFTGGTNVFKTIVSQSDIDEAAKNLTVTAEKDNKSTLLESIDTETTLAIESSFIQKVEDATPSVAVNEETTKDATLTLTQKTVASIYTLDLTKIKEYITEKAKVSENNKIYKLGSPFIEGFIQTDTGYTGKLKTSFMVGPNISETAILDSVKGILVGEVKSVLKDAGASEVQVERSFFWVNSVPNNPNKIDIELTVEE